MKRYLPIAAIVGLIFASPVFAAERDSTANIQVPDEAMAKVLPEMTAGETGEPGNIQVPDEVAARLLPDMSEAQSES